MAKKGFTLGVVVGSAIGAVVALLTAPKSGKETREDLKVKANEMKEKARDTAEDVKKKTDKFKDEAQKKASEAKKDTAEVVEDWKSRVGRVVETAKDEFSKQSLDDKKK